MQVVQKRFHSNKMVYYWLVSGIFKLFLITLVLCMFVNTYFQKVFPCVDWSAGGAGGFHAVTVWSVEHGVLGGLWCCVTRCAGDGHSQPWCGTVQAEEAGSGPARCLWAEHGAQAQHAADISPAATTTPGAAGAWQRLSWVRHHTWLCAALTSGASAKRVCSMGTPSDFSKPTWKSDLAVLPCSHSFGLYCLLML